MNLGKKPLNPIVYDLIVYDLIEKLQIQIYLSPDAIGATIPIYYSLLFGKKAGSTIRGPPLFQFASKIHASVGFDISSAAD
jgi:hypothetical protein